MPQSILILYVLCSQLLGTVQSISQATGLQQKKWFMSLQIQVILSLNRGKPVLVSRVYNTHQPTSTGQQISHSSADLAALQIMLKYMQLYREHD